MIGSPILPYWETHRWDKKVWRVLWLAASPGVWVALNVSASHNGQHCPEQLQLTWPLIVVWVYKIYFSNIECPIIREDYQSPESLPITREFTDHQRVVQCPYKTNCYRTWKIKILLQIQNHKTATLPTKVTISVIYWYSYMTYIIQKLNMNMLRSV